MHHWSQVFEHCYVCMYINHMHACLSYASSVGAEGEGWQGPSHGKASPLSAPCLHCRQGGEGTIVWGDSWPTVT